MYRVCSTIVAFEISPKFVRKYDHCHSLLPLATYLPVGCSAGSSHLMFTATLAAAPLALSSPVLVGVGRSALVPPPPPPRPRPPRRWCCGWSAPPATRRSRLPSSAANTLSSEETRNARSVQGTHDWGHCLRLTASPPPPPPPSSSSSSSFFLLLLPSRAGPDDPVLSSSDRCTHRRASVVLCVRSCVRESHNFIIGASLSDPTPHVTCACLA